MGEQALQGRTEELKERSIGVDVFCRAADYDTNTDHVVRSVEKYAAGWRNTVGPRKQLGRYNSP